MIRPADSQPGQNLGLALRHWIPEIRFPPKPCFLPQIQSHHLQSPSLRPQLRTSGFPKPRSEMEEVESVVVVWINNQIYLLRSFNQPSCIPALCSRSWASARSLTSRGSEIYLLTAGATVGWEHGGRGIFSLFLPWRPRTSWSTEALEHWERGNESFVDQVQEVIEPWAGRGTSFLWWSVGVGERNCALNSKWLI